MTDMWPSWRYGPNAAAAIFESAADVPEGWADSPDRVVVTDPPKNKGGRPKKNTDADPAS